MPNALSPRRQSYCPTSRSQVDVDGRTRWLGTGLGELLHGRAL